MSTRKPRDNTMRITQEQFNEVIDLLGHAATALAMHFSIISLDNEVEPEASQAEFEASKDRYFIAVAALYDSIDYPAVFLLASRSFNGKSGCSINRLNSDKTSESCMQFSVSIEGIVAQLNNDFRVDVEPLMYTGCYRLVQPNIIQSSFISISREEHNLPIPDGIREMIGIPRNAELNYEQPNPTFIMQIMSHPATPIIGAILFLAGVALIASGACAGFGAGMAATGAILMVGYAATKLGFFAGGGNQTMPDSPENTNGKAQLAV